MSHRIIFISKEFDPISNGTVTCVENILPYLGAKGELTLFSARTDWRAPIKEMKYGVSIERAYSNADMMVYMKRNLLYMISTSNQKNFIKRVLSFGVKSFFFLWQKKSEKDGYAQPESFERNICKYIEKAGMKTVDIIMAVGGPFENIRAALRLKEKYPEAKLILILFDLYTYNPVELGKDRENNFLQLRLEEEMRWNSMADVIVSAIETKDTISESLLYKWKSKYCFLHIPSLKILSEDSYFDIEKKADEVTVVYAGAFYEDIRNPLYTLELFKLVMSLYPHIKLYIIGKGCEKIVSRVAGEIGKKCIICGPRNRDYTLSLLKSADVLLSVGNSTPTQLPSKIMEYIGMRKPIIHVYSIEEDTCMSFLDKYPLIYAINENEAPLDKEARKVGDFIMQKRGMLCDIIEINKRYSEFGPDNFVEKVFDSLEKTFV